VAGVHPADALRREHPELVPLPLSADTVRSLERSYTGARVIAADEATPARVLAEVSGYRVVQFLVHAIHDSARARPTGLVLEPDGEDSGVLWAEVIAERTFEPLAPGLVMLTACRSAQAPTRRGDAGSADLGGAWLAAGAPAALVSHSELTWGTTIEFSEAFHQYLRGAGCSPAEALRRALDSLEVDDPRVLPFRYGLLEVIGLGQRAVFTEASAEPDRSTGLFASAFLLLGLVTSVVVWAARRTRQAA
jgi:CHAT domain-containing protein